MPRNSPDDPGRSSRARQLDERHLQLFGPKWKGPIFVTAGVLLLVSQVVAWLTQGILHTWLVGGGIGLLLVGGVAWFFYLDDVSSGAKSYDELPSAAKYDEMLDEMGYADQDHDI